MDLDGRASQRLRCTRSPCTDGKTPQIESRHLRFRHPEIPDARNSTQPQADTDLDGAWGMLLKNPKKLLHFEIRHVIIIKLSGRTGCAPLAQLDRASGYGPEGRGFESLRAYQQEACVL